MSESENNTTPATPTQPVFPPIDATKAVPPVTPFPAWTWNTPVIPQFYWNVYSSEQRIRQICVEIGRIQAYLEYFAANSNAAHWYLDNRFTQVETRLTARVDKLEKELGEEVARLDKALADETKNRTDGDKALQARIDATKTALEAETAARKAGDAALEAKLDAETGERRHDDAELGRRIDGKLAFGAVRAGDGITVANDPDTATATVSAEVTKAKLDEAIAGIPAYKLPTATAERLGGVKVGTGLTVTTDGTLNATGTGTGTGSGLETVSHDDTMDGDGTAGDPLKVNRAHGHTPGIVKPGQGLTVATEGTMNVRLGNGLNFNYNNQLEPKLGDGLIFSGDRVQVDTGRGFRFVADALEPNLGEGLAFSDNGAITATGAAGTSESVKVLYPQSTQAALGDKNTSGQRSVGEFLNYSAGVSKDGRPAPRFDVKRLEITKKQLTDNMGRGFRAADFTTVNGGFFNGATALKLNLQGMLATVYNSSTYRIASIVVVDFNTDDNGSMVIDGHSIITYFTATDSESLANTLNSIGDNAIVYDLYCVIADSELLDIYSR